MIVNGVTIPDLPSGMFDNYRYGVICKHISEGSDTYIAVATAGEVYGVILQTGEILTMSMSVGYSQYSYRAGESSNWELDEEAVDVEWSDPFYMTSASPATLVWSNHDIPELDFNTGEVTERFVFLDSTVADEYPEMLAVEGKWLWGVAEQVRRLSGEIQRYAPSPMLEALKNVDSATAWEKWEGSWIRDMVYDSSNGVFSVTILAEEPWMPLGMRLDNTLNHAYLPNATKIGSMLFGYCDSLKTIDAPLLTEISTLAMYNCTKLESVNFPVAQKVYFQAFTECKTIPLIDLPMANHIENQAFVFCNKLKTLILRNTNGVCELENTNAFLSTPIASGTGYIYVPSALVDSYKAAANWSTYAAQIRAIEDYPEICNPTE